MRRQCPQKLGWFMPTLNIAWELEEKNEREQYGSDMPLDIHMHALVRAPQLCVPSSVYMPEPLKP